MKKGRLEAFSDGVIAIVITIMVLELELPAGDDLPALRERVPAFLSYVLSFAFLGIYWNNHHHLLHTAERVNGAILWANLHLLFWLSLVPFATAWLGEHHAAPLPTALYGFVLLCAALAYLVLQTSIICSQGESSALKAALGSDRKGRLSAAGYLAALPLAFVHPGVAIAIYVAIALLWLVPDRRIERRFAE